MTTSQHVKRPRKGRGATRVDGYGPVARRATGVVISLGLAGGIVGGLAVGSATADPASLTLNYSCALPEPIGGYPVTVEMLSDIPTSITAGEPTSQFPIEARTPVTEHQAQMLHNIKVRSLDGTVTADVNVTAPQDDENFTIPFDVAKTTVPASRPGTDRLPTGAAAELRASAHGGTPPPALRRYG